MKKLFILTLLIFVWGCGSSKVWYRSDVSSAQAQRDLKECQYDMVKHNPDLNIYTGVWLINRCMELKGYEQIDREEVTRRGGVILQ